MAGATTNLQEMGLFLIRSLDAAKRQIAQIVPQASGATITYKDGTTAPVQIASDLSPSLFCNGYVVVRNNRENVQTLIENWNGAVTYNKLVLLFLDEKSGNKWLLRPHVHAKVAEPKTLSQGLLTLFEHSMGKA